MSEQTPLEGWEERYSGADRVWTGRVNAALTPLVSGLEPGRTLDLGCGEGGDAIWLAQHGWHATGVDLSPTAIDRARVAAADLGVTERTQFLSADLTTWAAAHEYDLVTASFLHSWFEGFPREEILRRATHAVARGGRMAVIAHAEAPPWSTAAHDGHVALPTPAADLAALELDPGEWDTLVCETREREVTAADGTLRMLRDSVVVVRRRLAQ